MRGFREELVNRLSGFCQLSSQQIGQLEHHYVLLRKWNKVINLTSIESEAEIIERHYCESIFLAVHLPEGALRIVDVGSGGGFPGIPVAIIHPESSVTLVESHQRKAVFLREATRDLPNVRVVAVRSDRLAETFDWAISRAVSYAQIRKDLARLASHVAILTGENGNGIPLPWGRKRFLKLFHVKQ